MDEDQEREVALGLRGGQPDAWRTLYEAFAPRVWRAVARLLGPCPADVADVVQETFMAAARSARMYDPDRGPLWAWLWGIARRHVALHYRAKDRLARLQKAREWLALTECHDGVPADALEEGELAALVRATLAELPAGYESLLTAKYLDEEPVECIAARERASGAAVRSKLARARQAFRDAFGRHSRSEDCPVGSHHDAP